LVHDPQAFGLDHAHALAGLQHGTLLGWQVSPLRLGTETIQTRIVGTDITGTGACS
jgi:hypothetical protein